jgi:Nucleotidyl transferase AbiEii toxin, Type IV TA system
MQAQLSTAEIKLALDVNFGDPVTPAPSWIDYPSVLSTAPAVRVLGYPIATVLAEKIVTALSLGAINTRTRDYADLWTLTGIHDLDAEQVRRAIVATADHRDVLLRPLSDAVADLATAQSDGYAAYRLRLDTDGLHLPTDFGTVIADIIAFADPLLEPDPPMLNFWSAAERRWHGARRGATCWPPATGMPVEGGG